MSNSFIAKRNDGAVMVLINLPDDEYEEAVVSLSKAEDTDRFESFHFPRQRRPSPVRTFESGITWQR